MLSYAAVLISKGAWKKIKMLTMLISGDMYPSIFPPVYGAVIDNAIYHR